MSRHNTLRDTAIKLAKIEMDTEVMRDTLYSQNKTFHEPKPDHEIDKIIEWVSETISPDTNDSHSFKLISGLEALTMKLPKREMIVEEIIGRHKVIAVAAKTNAGKSIWVHQLGLALALGLDKIFGFKISRSHKVLFLNFEMDERELIERHQLLVTGIENRNDALLENFNFNTFGGKRSLFQDNWDSIDRTVIETGPYDLIIVDNLYACTGKNDEKNHDLKSILKRIISVSDFNDSSILIVNHHKKHSDEEVDLIMRLMDMDKSGTIKLPEYTKMLGVLEYKQTPNAEHMKQMFSSLDKDKSGCISEEEIKSLWNLFANNVDSELDDVEDIMKKMDSNKDGKIDYKEFVKKLNLH